MTTYSSAGSIPSMCSTLSGIASALLLVASAAAPASAATDHYQSYPGIVHGGVIAAMLDEVVARVSMIGDPHHFMMSVKLQILYRHPVPVETPLRVVGRILRLRGRLGKAEGGVYLPDGTLAAEAHMSLADVPKELLASTNPRLLNWKVD